MDLDSDKTKTALRLGLEKAVDLIKREEGFRSQAYADTGYGWQAATIGYGTARVYPSSGEPVRRGDTITPERAENELYLTLGESLETIMNNVKVELNSNQVASLLSFVYNVGPTRFQKSTLLRRLNSGDYAAAKEELPKYNISNGRPLEVLTKRRNAEAKLFNTPEVDDTPVAVDATKPVESVVDAPSEAPTRDFGSLSEAAQAVGSALVSPDSSEFIPAVRGTLKRMGQSLGLTQSDE